MLKKENRFSGFDKKLVGIDYTSPLFKLKFYKEEGIVKFGFIVSKKIDKRAVIRNNTKRVYRKIINDLLPEIKQKGAFVFYSKQKVNFLQEEKLKKDIVNAFQKLKII